MVEKSGIVVSRKEYTLEKSIERKRKGYGCLFREVGRGNSMCEAERKNGKKEWKER